MTRKILLILIIALCTIAVGCKHPSKDKVDKSIPFPSKHIADQTTDILKYKIKEERHQKDSLDLTFKKIILEKIASVEYKLTIDMETEPSKIQFHKDYYVIIALYPEDDKIGLLAPDRKKYGFESFSAKFEINQRDELVIKRKLRTKIKFARAITVTVMEYKNNRKSQMVIMQNVFI